MADEVHLGDGVYASFSGFDIQLRSPRSDGDHVIFLELPAFQALQRFVSGLGSPWCVEQAVERILVMTDAEVIADCEAHGHDPAAEAVRCRAILDKALASAGKD